MSKLSLQRTVGLALELEAVIGNADHVGSPMQFANEARAGFDLGPWRRQAWFEGFVAFPPLDPVLFEMALHSSSQIFIDDRCVFSRKRFALVDDLAPRGGVGDGCTKL